MTDWDLSGSEENTSEWSELLPSAESIIQGFKIPLEINRGVQKLIIDYTLGAAIIGLIPASLSGKMGLFVLGLINLKMVLDIWCCWGKPKEKRIQMIIVILFAFLGGLGYCLSGAVNIFTIRSGYSLNYRSQRSCRSCYINLELWQSYKSVLPE